jgi:hypothetical protein
MRRRAGSSDGHDDGAAAAAAVPAGAFDAREGRLIAGALREPGQVTACGRARARELDMGASYLEPPGQL